MPRRKPIAALLTLLLTLPNLVHGQQAPAQPAVPPGTGEPQAVRPSTGALKILVLQGQNAINSLTSKTALSPVVQILDAVEQPVEGATVTFEVSPTGPGGSFDGAPIATVKTDFTGQATAALTPNDTPGSFSIKVTAVLGEQSAQLRIRQTNDRNAAIAMMPLPPKPWYKNWKKLAMIGGVAGAGIAATVILVNKDQTSTITIFPGSVTIGGLR
ncbi:MAG: hypothetical protein IH602_01000 [Bryobacteraceae bacterium]|nr:hypothetical protein [Bryobacteraceae bacterium]